MVFDFRWAFSPTPEGGFEVGLLDLVNNQGGGDKALLRALLHVTAAPPDRWRSITVVIINISINSISSISFSRSLSMYYYY